MPGRPDGGLSQTRERVRRVQEPSVPRVGCAGPPPTAATSCISYGPAKLSAAGGRSGFGTSVFLGR